jgi:folate-dependent phosphoribosylglycinamide formyltransferase PurN
MMHLQSAVGRQRQEIHYTDIMVYTEVSTALRAVAADFLFIRRYLEMLSDNFIQHVPRRVHNHAPSSGLGALQDFCVGRRSCTQTFIP